MTAHQGPFHPRRARHAAFLTGVSALAILAASPSAHARQFGSSQTVAPPTIAADAASEAAQQAAKVAKQARDSLSRATQAIRAMQGAQATARAAAQAAQKSTTLSTTIPNGLGTGGLLPNVPGGWSGANQPTQSVDASGQTNVNINQNTAQAILNWVSFNVGARTTLTFDQHGNASWVALNRVDAGTGPSQILGNIKADGTVLVINQSGIIFGGASQINVGSLIASTAAMPDGQFLNNGIYSAANMPSFANARGKVIVEQGALITTSAPASVTEGGGYVLLMGTEVSNAGSITTPRGQTELAAGDDFILRQGFGTDNGNTYSTTRGNEIAPVIHAGSASGTVTNAGLVFSQQGDVTLAGHTVVQDGILLSTTSVNQRGTIHLLNSASDSSGSVTLTENSLALILPELDSTDTALNSQRDALIKDSAYQNDVRSLADFGQFDNLSRLADREDQSRIEIVTGGTVNFQTGSLTQAQGGQVTVSAGNTSAAGHIVVDSGAVIDVSGVQGMLLPMSTNEIQVNVEGNDLRDSPQNRDSGNLSNKDVWIDVRDLILVPAGTGGYATDRYYTPGGLLEVSGYLNNTGHTIGEWAAVGGSITLSAAEVVAQQGSTFNIAGGSVQYQGGYLQQTYVLGSDGGIYNINDAPADFSFKAVVTGFVVDHPHWGVTEIYQSPWGNKSAKWEEGYTVGRDAGSLILSTSASIFSGDIVADVINGERQTQSRPSSVTDGYKFTQNTVASNGSLLVELVSQPGPPQPITSDVTFGVAPASGTLAAGLFDAAAVSAANLGGITVLTTGNVAVNAPLSVAPGGSIALGGRNVTANANVTARGGSIFLGDSDAVLSSGAGNVSGSVVLAAGVTLDTRGLWTNIAADGDSSPSRLAYLNGGSVSVIVGGDLTLQEGSSIDTSAGGAILATGKLSGGDGGDLTLSSTMGTVLNGGSAGRLVLDGALRGYGFGKGGRLSLRTGGRVIIGDDDVAVGADDLHLDASLFQSGFSSYTINGEQGLVVADDAHIAAAMPVLTATAATWQVPTGGDVSAALSKYLAPLYTEDPFKGVLTQRAGVDVNLRSGVEDTSNIGMVGGAITIGSGASIDVDAGRSVTVASGGQVTVDGHISAPGGDIAILNEARLTTADPGALSVWIGDDAVLDAAARAYTATDSRGRSYGVVPDGGSIVLGSQGGTDPITHAQLSTPAMIIVRPGATLDASGTSAQIDLTTTSGLNSQSARTLVASDGGSITLSSYDGLFIDGTLRGQSGGAGASGGSLSVVFESPVYSLSSQNGGSEVPQRLRAGRVLTVSQTNTGSGLAADLAPGESAPTLRTVQARIGGDQISAGGFDSVSLWGRNGIAFDGDVNLSFGRSLTLLQGPIYDMTAAGRVALSAPYVFLDGATTLTLPTGFYYAPNVLPTYSSGANLTIDGALVDVRNTVKTYFGDTRMVSRGDLRFLAATDTPIAGQPTTILAASNDLDLTAQQLYPATGALVQVLAGPQPTGQADFANTSTIRIASVDGSVPAMPYSVFGNIGFSAGVIEQGGVVRAPMGSITLGGSENSYLTTTFVYTPTTTLVSLLPGSITSVSAAGLVMPYGGTVDGVSFTVDGHAPITAGLIDGQMSNVTAGNGLNGLQGVTLRSSNVAVDAGAKLDLSGGGTLTGAAFISGRGGSVDVLTTALANANPANTYSSKDNKVYAIVPGVVTTAVAGSYYSAWTGAVPGVGQQITIPDGVPGLAAGTYTLLPANYALLPGAYRVELGASSTQRLAGATAVGNGSYVTSGFRSVSNTAIRDALPTQLVVTPGAAVRSYSQYNETGYDAFELANVATTGALRPALTVDAKGLTIQPGTYVDATPTQAPFLTFQGSADFSPAEGGYAGALTIAAPANLFWAGTIVITADNSDTMRSALVTPIDASALNNIGAPILYIGGRPTVNASSLVWSNNSVSLRVEGGAILRGAHVVLAAGGLITLDPGAVIDTLGWNANIPDSSLGYLYGPDPISNSQAARGSASLLIASNGDVEFNTPSGGGTGRIVVGDGAAIYADGTIGFYADQGVSFSGKPLIGAKYLSLAMPSINIGESAALASAQAAGVLPAGLNLDQGTLVNILTGAVAAGAPKVERLTLGATQSVNFFGNVDLDLIDATTGAALLKELVLETPAIYGSAAAGEHASVSLDTLVWNGKITLGSIDGTGKVTFIGATPGAVQPGGAGTGEGSLDISAREIVFGYPSPSKPDSTIEFNRLMLGFSNVTFGASEEIVSNNTGNLSVYASGPSPDANYDAKSYAGTGGNLNLVAPLLTGDPGSTMSYRSGGVLTVSAPAGGPSSASNAGGLGAIVNLTGDSIRVATSVALPSGRLTMTAAHDVTIDTGAYLDLSGRAVQMFDVTQYSWGGDVVAESAHGNIMQAANSVIDLSAQNNDAGTLTLTATDATAGSVRLDGVLTAHGGAGHTGGGIDIRAQTIGGDAASLSADFASLNARLDGGGFSGSRSFVLKQGDLGIGGRIAAQNVSVSIDGGSLTVTGTIDASGASPGSISLAARDDLTLASSSILDVHSNVLQMDGYGQVIEADNRGHITLTSSQGWLRLNPGATMDVSSPDGAARGEVVLNTGRTGETSGDMRIDARAPLTIKGAGSIVLNAFWTYTPTDAAGTIRQDNGGTAPLGDDGSVGLKQIDMRNSAFIDAALANDDLASRMAGLSTYASAFHLRPGVEIDSAPNGNLTVSGDLDLSGYRYGPEANRDTTSSSYGAGEPLSFVVRAAGNLTINGSISDGFKARPEVTTPPHLAAINISSDSQFTYTVDPVDGDFYYDSSDETVVFSQAWVIPDTQFYNSFGVYTDSGTFYGGQTIPAGTTSIAYAVYFEAASALPSLSREVPGTTTPAAAATSSAALMLAAGSQSASIRLVSGADLNSADTRNVLGLASLGGGGNLSLNNFAAPALSVIRTGTGDLDALSGGTFSQSTAYGIYTAGTDTSLGAADVKYSSLGAYFPDHGGDLTIAVQGNLTGSTATFTFANDGFNVGNWVLRQGSNTASIATAWGIAFNRFVGFGALGGGDVNITVGGDAGNLTSTGLTPLAIAVGGTGRVTSVATENSAVTGGTLAETGGGDITLRIGGRLNPGIRLQGQFNEDDTNGTFTVLRGDLDVRAATIGVIPLVYGTADRRDPRPASPYDAVQIDNNGGTAGGAAGGPVVVLGDGAVTVQTLGDLVLGGVGDPGFVQSGSTASQFSLWRPDTSIDLFSAGGNLVPVSMTHYQGNDGWGGGQLLPGIFRATAASGSIYYGDIPSSGGSIVLAPSPEGQLDLLAWGSIFGDANSLFANSSTAYYGIRFGMSGAADDPNSIPTPFRPATSSNGSAHGFSYFWFGAGTATDLHAGDDDPIRIYAVTGDLNSVTLGGNSPVGNLTSVYDAAKSAIVRAGRDIVGFGLLNDPQNGGTTRRPAAIMNVSDTDVSLIQAGRDIFYLNVEMAGPGELDVIAGRNLYQADKGAVTSIGSIVTGDNRQGASVAITAGAGSNGPDYAAIAAVYLDPANLATIGVPLADQPGKVVKTYQAELTAWLKQRYGYEAASTADALAYFAALPPAQQQIFLRQVYFAELKAGGREYNDPSSPRYNSYLRGREAIATLFPDDASYAGDVTMFGASGVRTLFGGDISILTPGGKTVVGVEGAVPAANSGVITQGQGDISFYSNGSILLGLSRIMTTFGGNILAWSAEGDINAGRGAKTTVLYTPPKRVSDPYGRVTLSPSAPSTGAGIATLNPIPEVPPGDIDLIAPLGVIDAGEAGIRVSGNVNLAALQVVNAANIQVQGTSAGLPTVQGPPVAALTSASNTAAATEQSVQPTGGNNKGATSVMIVEIIGYGGSDGGEETQPEDQRRRNGGRQGNNQTQDPRSRYQVVGVGDLTDDQAKQLTEQRRLEVGR